MSDAFAPGPDAKARIQALGQKALLEFFGEVPPGAMQQVARFLPSVPGFRKTSAAGIAKQKEAVARKLSRPGASDRDYHSLYVIWRSWIDAKFPNAPLANELIDRIEEAADESGGAESRRTAIEKHVDSLLETLKDESQQNKCTREQIERLFTFSPFPETGAARALIAAAKPASEVNRDAELSALPQRLQHDEGEIQSIKAEMKALSDRLEPLASSVQAVFGKLPGWEAKLASVKVTAESLRGELQEEKAAQRNETAQGERVRAAADTRLQGISERVDGLSNELRKAAASLSAVAELREAIDRIAGIQKTLVENEQANVNRIEQLSGELAQIERRLATINSDRTVAEQISSLGERLNELEQRKPIDPPASSSAQAEEPSSYSSGIVLDIRSELTWESLAAADGNAPPALRTHTEIAGAFTKALLALGLRKSAGQVFAEECVAAVVARQVVFLKGALATHVARALARVVAGPGSTRIGIPIGLQDGEMLRRCMASALGGHPGFLGGVAVEGVNRTALDVTKEVILDFVEGSTEGLGRAAIFATIAGGIAALPVERSYFELGPVFDLDYLDWRTNPDAEPELAESVVSIEADRAILREIGSVEANTEEAIRLARLYQPKRSPGIERVFTRAYQALHKVRSEQKTVTALQSLNYGWLLPYWRVLGLSKEEIDSELDGGKCNATAPDRRLAEMVAVEFGDAGRSDGRT